MPYMSENKIGYFFSLCFLKDQYFWKLLCVCCAGFLGLDLLLECFMVKPTVSSFQQMSLVPGDIPDILVCKDVGFDPEQLGIYGYSNVSKYNDGIGNNGKFVGWSGFDIH